MRLKFVIRSLITVYILVICKAAFANQVDEEPVSFEKAQRAFSILNNQNYGGFLSSCGDIILEEMQSGRVKLLETKSSRFEVGGGGIRGADTILVSSKSTLLQFAKTACHERVHLSDVNALMDMGSQWVKFVDEGRVAIDRLHFEVTEPEEGDPHKAFLFSAFLFCTEYRAYKYTLTDFDQENTNEMAKIIQNLYLLKLGVFFLDRELFSLRNYCEKSRTLEEFIRDINRSDLKESYVARYSLSAPAYVQQDENPKSSSTKSISSVRTTN